jgi:hypothetical protein
MRRVHPPASRGDALLERQKLPERLEGRLKIPD